MSWLSADGRPGLISVIVPSFDRRDMLVELLDALAAQTWPTLELIVVDDGSTDGTLDRVKQWQQAHPEPVLIAVRQENAGAAAARNRGLAEANGEFIYFIDSDDLIVPEALEAMASAMQVASAPYCLASIVNTDLSGTPIIGNHQGVPRLGAAGDAFGASWLMHAALYRRQTVIAAGPFDESLPLAEDNLFRWKVVIAFPRGQVLGREVGIRHAPVRPPEPCGAGAPPARDPAAGDPKLPGLVPGTAIAHGPAYGADPPHAVHLCRLARQRRQLVGRASRR